MSNCPEIFLYEGEQEKDIEKLTLEELSAIHPVWGNDCEKFAPWKSDSHGVWYAKAQEGAPVIVSAQCNSSLDLVKSFAEQGRLPEWGAVLAVSQRSGRGQLRRHWVSPVGNIYAAWYLPRFAPEWDAVLPLVLGVLCAETFKEYGIPVQVKWPNDLLVYGKKVGGILIEERGEKVYAGIGINLVSAPEDAEIRESWSPKASSLQKYDGVPGPLSVWLQLVNRAECWYKSTFCSPEVRNFLEYASQNMAYMDQEVLVHDSNGEYRATVLGLAEDGGLILFCSGKRHVLYTGSISPA